MLEANLYVKKLSVTMDNPDSQNPIRPLLETMEFDEPSSRKGESPVRRALMAWLMLGLHLVLVCVVVASLIVFVDEVQVNSGDDRWLGSGGQPMLLASDITTAVSAALVVVRVVTGSWTAITAWRCVYILLEKDSLSLGQLNFMVAYKIPSKISGGYSWLVVVILLLLLPAQFAAPLASGAVGWQNVQVLLENHNVTSAAVEFPNGTLPNWWWNSYFANQPTRSNMVIMALRKSFELFLDEEQPKTTGCRRLVKSDLSVGSTVSDTPIPCLVVHSIKWDTTPPSKDLTDLLSSPSNSVLHEENPSSTVVQENPILGDNIGNIAILGLPVWSSIGKTGVPHPPTIFSGSWKIACMYNHFNSDGSCNPGPFQTDSLNSTQPVAAYQHLAGPRNNCYIFGTINVTAGVTSSASTVISRGVLEVDSDPNLRIEANALTEESIYLMNDLVVAMNIASQFIIPWGLTSTYSAAVERFFRRSFISAWHGIRNELRYGWESGDKDGSPMVREGGPPYHVSAAKMKAMRLQAIVSRPRVVGWLVANLLMTLSGVILAVAQSRCSRPVVIDHAAAAMTVDVHDLLEKDTNGLSNLSYLTNEDDKLGKLVLTPRQLRGGLQFALVPKQPA